MALKLSTGLRNALAGTQATISNSAGAQPLSIATTSTITDSDSSFLTSGFRDGQYVICSGSGTAGNNRPWLITSVVAATLTVDNVDNMTTESSDTDFAVTQWSGGLRQIFQHSVLRIYSGAQPSDADTAESGTLLVTITVSSAAFTAGTETNGLDFGAPASGVVSKATGETWSGAAAATGTAGWFRLYSNAYVTGASTAAIRLDGTCATSGGQLNLSSTSITSGATITIDTFAVTVPAS